MCIFAVTPLAGVWIEIMLSICSHRQYFVTPLAGVWIEIFLKSCKRVVVTRHSPCGSVD